MKNPIDRLSKSLVALLVVGLWLTATLMAAGQALTGSASPVVKFAVIGDSGTGGEDQKRVAAQMLAWHDINRYEFVLMVGDNIYPSGNPRDYPKKFEQPYAPLLARGVKFYAALGNHDVRGDNEHYAIHYPHFNMGGQRYYTFIKGDGLVQFFALDSTTMSDGQRDHDQLRWLTEALSASQAQWKIAFFHHPLYSSGQTHGSSHKLRAILEPILLQGNVQVVFSGHDHVYERLVPQRGIHYFVTGAAGKLRRGDLDRTSKLTVKGNDQVHHFMYIEIDARQMRFQAVSKHGEVFDQGTIPASLP